MNLLWVLVLVVLNNGLFSSGASASTSKRPEAVKIGTIFSYSSDIGKVAKIAVEAAVEDVNSNPAVLGGTKLELIMQDSNYSYFLAMTEALRLMGKDIVAIVGPQSSVTAHLISHIANELKVPLVSFSATDPTLSALQFPFFVRTTQNDLFQMAAIAEIIEYFEWSQVIAIYGDDDFGRNGIAALADQLAAKRCQISLRAALRPQPSRTEITDVLVKVALEESRVLVLQTDPSWGLDVLDVAQHLGMMGGGYVWIASNWLSTVLDTSSPLPSNTTDNMQGLITLRMYTPDSELKRNFVSRWHNLTSDQTANGRIGLNTYGLYAYDTVWMLAHAIGTFLDQGGNISFSNDSRLSKDGGNLHLDAMSIFDGGNLLLDNILQVNFTGLTGPITFDSDRSLIHPAYEVINVVGTGIRKIGYWSNYSGLSVVPPDTLYSEPPNRSLANQHLYGPVWPGQTTEKPRGWGFPSNGRQMKIGVPNRVTYNEFVQLVPNTDNMFKGYCIDVFTAALSLLPYVVPYKFIPYGDGHYNRSFTELVRLISAGVYDAAVGDIAITTNRTRMADFTQPYMESGLVVVAPVKKINQNAWAFLRPFTPLMWSVTALFFLIVGAVVWILEHRINDEFRGPPRKQLMTILWFSFSTMFFSHKENTVSTLGRLVLIIWLFVVLIITSSYTASLTSILTVQQLYSPVKGIESLMTSNDPVGYQSGSFVPNYLSAEFGMQASRMVPFNTPEEYAEALRKGPKNGGVAAVVDERAYLELFLSTRCEFSIVGPEFSKNGWGFAFPRESPLAVDMSTAILKLSETGELQRIHDKWLMGSACSSQDSKLDRLPLGSFKGLFLLCGLACLLALFIYFILVVRQFMRRHYVEESDSSGGSSRSGWLQTFLTFIDKKEEDVNMQRVRKTTVGEGYGIFQGSPTRVRKEAIGG